MPEPIKLPAPFRPYVKESELADRIDDLLDEYSDEISAVSAVGILNIIALRIMNDSIESENNL